MYGKVFILFLSTIALIEGTGKCPDPNGGTDLVNCTLVLGCNYAENGTLTILATQCSNELDDSDCELMFPCNSTATPACRDPADVGGATEDLYPYVRAPACTEPDMQDIALQCKYVKVICDLYMDL